MLKMIFSLKIILTDPGIHKQAIEAAVKIYAV
jgi:hypothetical protein